MALAALLLASLAGCPDNPYKASTWTKKLDDSHEIEHAVTQLEQLGDPSAIPALGEAWKKNGRPVRLLQVIIELARPLTPEQAKATYMTDYESTGRPASWAAAMPYLELAIQEVDEANPRSVDSAQKAADAMGDAQISESLDALVELGSKQPSKKLIAAQISAIRAIGKFDNDKSKAAQALIKIISVEPPDHPRTAKDKEQARLLEEKYGLYLGVTGASINALADLRVPSAVKPLIISMYRTPELFTQIRRALVASGPSAETELRSILRGEDKEVNDLFVSKRLDKYCGDRNDEKDCQPVSAKDFYPAVVLGDFYDPASVPDLLAALERPPAPQYWSDDQPSGSTQYNAIFDALRKIGAPDGADKIHAMWSGHEAPAPKGRGRGRPAPVADTSSTDPMTRILAIGAYPFVARDDSGVDELGKIAFDNHADPDLRTEAATAFARLSHDPAHIKELNDLADQYYKQSAEYRAKADAKPKADADAADKDLERAKKAFDDAKANALKATHDSSKTADDIHNATAAAQKAEDDYKAAKVKHKDAVKPFKELDARAKGLKNSGRMFQTHIARIEVALRCKNDLSCFAKTLTETPDDAKSHLASYIRDIGSWSKDDILGLEEGEVERAMLELGKQGQKASQYADALLDAAKSDDRLIRQSILLALPKIAKVPCTECETKLDAAIRAGEGKSTLGDLNLETTMLRNYFAWAGGNTPHGATDVPEPTAPTAPPPKSAPAPAPAPAKPAPKGKHK
ncbi:MAG TPA: hypothetical protein VLX92_24170 [Kofleriaceae bacterium]|nr:hypothetical protein [Kofleriaceae bacterium]